jgi:polysaccharide export outer membrane protein
MFCKAQTTHRLCICAVLLVLPAGCQHQQLCAPADSQLPRELSKVSLPPYVIEPPDILLLEAVRVVPLPPYKIEPLDVLQIQVTDLPELSEPITGLVSVEPDGRVNLGINYGSVSVLGLTLKEAEQAIVAYLKTAKRIKTDVKAQVVLAQSRGLQQIRGEHLVRQDGVISLGTYGNVYVTGMTVAEARAAVEAHLSRFMLNPEVRLDILAYNSKVYYVIADGGGFGQQIVRLPITGNETVLDAISQISGLPAQASKKHIWVARPTPAHNCGDGSDQILPVDWNAIVECGQTATNYQILPGDRVYVKADALITFDNVLSKITAPMERLFGVTILGNAMVHDLGNKNGNGTGSNSGVGF